ncbi:MAG: hypothetical protein GY832_01880 [Chloroflexi bacterium]|nr:hypothetical protein [Chloroflexota bacterium]
MHLIPFYIVDIELADKEIRMMHLLAPHNGLPAGSYAMVEFYCPDPACDCQRVTLNIVEEKHPKRFLASISYSFDRKSDMAGPFLDPMNRKSKYAEKLLQLVEDVVLADRRYVARLKRHYKIVKRAASNPKHPAYAELQKILAGDAKTFSLPRVGRKSRKKPPKQKAKSRRNRRKR